MALSYPKKKKKLRLKAEKLWNAAIFKIYGKVCYCGTKANAPHHFFPKSVYGHLKFDLNNGVPLCKGHHFSHHHKGDPEVHQRVIEKKGEKWFKELRKKATTRPPMSYQTLEYYRETIERLKKVLEA